MFNDHQQEAYSVTIEEAKPAHLKTMSGEITFDPVKITVSDVSTGRTVSIFADTSRWADWAVSVRKIVNTLIDQLRETAP